MKFPGSNKLEMSMDAVKELIANHISTTFSAGSALRVTNVEVSGSYSAKTLDVTFTTDRDPLDSPPMAGLKPDDNEPF